MENFENQPVDPNNVSKKERRMMRRAERKDEQSKAVKTKSIQRWLWWAGGIIIIAGLILLVVYSGNQSVEPLGADFSESIEDQGQVHIEEGQRVPNYNSNPPTSGPHWPVPLRDGLYETERPDEGAVHALEHGRIWVTYRPDISEEIISQLTELLDNEPHIVLSPREANETDIALAAWTRLDKINLNGEELDTKRIIDFVIRYRDKGPEFVPQSTGKTYDNF